MAELDEKKREYLLQHLAYIRKPLSENSKKILEVFKANPTKEFSPEELSVAMGLKNKAYKDSLRRFVETGEVLYRKLEGKRTGVYSCGKIIERKIPTEKPVPVASWKKKEVPILRKKSTATFTKERYIKPTKENLRKVTTGYQTIKQTKPWSPPVQGEPPEIIYPKHYKHTVHPCEYTPLTNYSEIIGRT